MVDVKKAKERIRRHIWDLLEQRNLARFPRPVHGRIPNFVGAEEAAKRIIVLDVWIRARVVKANPDSPQKPLRRLALYAGKILLMATPRLKKGFLLLEPRLIPPGMYDYAASIRGAFTYGRLVRLEEIPRVDLIITGCVAVDREGNRLGKGGGYAELEYAILRELGLVDEDTPIFTTIHDVQLVDSIPYEEHDLTVDVAATPTRLHRFPRKRPRPRGIYWELLGDKADLPVIRELRRILRR